MIRIPDGPALVERLEKVLAAAGKRGGAPKFIAQILDQTLKQAEALEAPQSPIEFVAEIRADVDAKTAAKNIRQISASDSSRLDRLERLMEQMLEREAARAEEEPKRRRQA